MCTLREAYGKGARLGAPEMGGCTRNPFGLSRFAMTFMNKPG